MNNIKLLKSEKYYKRQLLEFAYDYPQCFLYFPLGRVGEYNDIRGKECVLSIYFGVPGSGKTTFAASLVDKSLKRRERVFSNVPITGAYEYDPRADFGIYQIENCRIILDEASVEYNNRDFKSLGKSAIKFFKYHRHYVTAIDCFSQAWDDIDITLRRLAQNIYWVKRSIIPYFMYAVPIKKTFDILDGQIIDSYVIQPFWCRRYIFAPKYWSLFNTLSREQLKKKVFKKY